MRTKVSTRNDPPVYVVLLQFAWVVVVAVATLAGGRTVPDDPISQWMYMGPAIVMGAGGAWLIRSLLQHGITTTARTAQSAAAETIRTTVHLVLIVAIFVAVLATRSVVIGFALYLLMKFVGLVFED